MQCNRPQTEIRKPEPGWCPVIILETPLSRDVPNVFRTVGGEIWPALSLARSPAQNFNLIKQSLFRAARLRWTSEPLQRMTWWTRFLATNRFPTDLMGRSNWGALS